VPESAVTVPQQQVGCEHHEDCQIAFAVSVNVDHFYGRRRVTDGVSYGLLKSSITVA
jgi:hypothetical protein